MLAWILPFWFKTDMDSLWQNLCLAPDQTSLKIFKHYKLKPSFSIIKDEKTKDKVGVGDKPPPPSFNELIKFDPILSSLIQFDPI